MKRFIIEYSNAHPNTQLLVTIDHSMLVKKNGGTESDFEKLARLGEMLTELKKMLPVLFIILTQMNRSIEDPNRTTPGTTGNYPRASDIYGSDALMQHSDIVMIINKPSKSNIKIYGPERYIVPSDYMVCHFVKCRNGDEAMTFMEHKKLENRFVWVSPPPKEGEARPQPIKTPPTAFQLKPIK